MNPYERLMAEAIPAGLHHVNAQPWTPEQQAEHLAALEAEVAANDRQRRNRRKSNDTEPSADAA